VKRKPTIKTSQPSADRSSRLQYRLDRLGHLIEHLVPVSFAEVVEVVDVVEVVEVVEEAVLVPPFLLSRALVSSQAATDMEIDPNLRLPVRNSKSAILGHPKGCHCWDSDRIEVL